MKSKELRLVIEGEEVIHVFLKMVDCFAHHWHQVVVSCFAFCISSEVLHECVRVQLAHSKIVQVFSQRFLPGSLLGRGRGQTRLFDHVFVDEVLNCLSQDVFVLLIDELATIVKITDQILKQMHR